MRSHHFSLERENGSVAESTRGSARYPLTLRRHPVAVNDLVEQDFTSVVRSAYTDWDEILLHRL